MGDLCLQCGFAAVVAEHRPFCCGHCRAGYLATERRDSRTDWLGVRLRQMAIRRSWSATERAARCVERPQPVEMAMLAAPNLRTMS